MSETLRSFREFIESRRTVFKFKPEPLPTELVEEILSVGIWAPNHHLTEPWRFTIVGEQTRQKLAERYRELSVAKAAEGISEEARRAIGEKAYQKFMARPTLVVVSCVQEGDEQQKLEDYAATCCAMMLIQLAGWEKGVGMQWSTGPLTRDPLTYDLLGIDPEKETIVGFYYMGLPAEIPQSRRKPLHDVLRRVD